MIRDNPSWGRTRLSQEICDTLHWKQTNGRGKERACRVALVRLESLGFLSLPDRKVESGGKPPAVGPRVGDVPETSITQMPEAIEVREVKTRNEAGQWNMAVAAHHYLGLSTPVGRIVRYLCYGDGTLVAAISFSDCAWKVKAREHTLRVSGLQGLIHRDNTISNSRFLILPWIEVPNLASRLLGLAVRAVRDAWESKYGLAPLLAETFVDPRYYLGTCYKAAGWIQVGATRGFAKKGSSHEFLSKPKLLFLRGLTPEIQLRLQSGALGRVA